jgi:hypothetical protein
MRTLAGDFKLGRELAEPICGEASETQAELGLSCDGWQSFLPLISTLALRWQVFALRQW